MTTTSVLVVLYRYVQLFPRAKAFVDDISSQKFNVVRYRK